MNPRRLLFDKTSNLDPALGNMGFTLVGGLDATVVFVVVVTGSLAAFNLATSGVFRTGRTANANAAVDSDIARIKRLAEDYSACVVPQGSILPNCLDADGEPIPQGSSWYYVPGTAAALESFRDACASASEGSHITRNLINAINQLNSDLGQGVARAPAVREEPGNASNHLIVIRYQSSQSNINRVVKIAPVVSAWCP